MPTSIFDAYKTTDLHEFVERWSALEDINKTHAMTLAQEALAYYSGSKTARQDRRPFQELEARWYRSLACGAPDYSVYGERYFLSDIWACWVLYSRKYLLSIDKKMRALLPPVCSVADLGNGFGYTTAGLKELFPSADVFGTNFEGGIQWRFAERVGAERGFSLAPNIQALSRHVSLVFASEYFEHIENPVEHLNDIVTSTRPCAFVLANAFGTESVGHFVEYTHSSPLGMAHKLDGKATSRAFGKALREHGYTKAETGCWNDRPALWLDRR